MRVSQSPAPKTPASDRSFYINEPPMEVGAAVSKKNWVESKLLGTLDLANVIVLTGDSFQTPAYTSRECLVGWRMCVVVVEDDALVRDVVAGLLIDAGLEVYSLSNPADALAWMAVPPRVLVTDVNLAASVDGYELAVAMRRRWPAIAVLLMSGRPDSLKGRRLHALDRFLQKPFCGQTLTGLVRTLMRGQMEGEGSAPSLP